MDASPPLPAENKRRIIEGIVERIEIKQGRPEIEITFSSTAPTEDMTTNQHTEGAEKLAGGEARLGER